MKEMLYHHCFSTLLWVHH